MVQQRVGTELAESSYSWKTLMNLGASVSNGSDCPVELPRVMSGIQCAVTRCDLNGYGPYLAQEAFTVQEALDSFTKSGAWASFEESKKGQIKHGMLADFVVLSENPFEFPANHIKDIAIVATYLGGKKTFG
jgi:predicted amidohydrolase YtcJ